VIKFQAWVIALLEKYRQGVDPQAANGPAHNLVFVAKRGRPIREPKFVRRYFKPLLKEAELPNIRLYDLCHGAATLALAAGVSPKIISEQLEHASVAFTLDVYSHALPHMQDAAAENVQALLAGPKADAKPPQTAASLTPVADFPDQ
jgi:integrase